MLREWKEPLLIRADNSEAYFLATNEARNLNDRTKHIDIKHHFIRKKVEQKKIRVNIIRSEDNVADVLTKPLTRKDFERMRKMLDVRSSSTD